MTETYIMCFYELATTHKAPRLLCTCPCNSDTPSVAERMAQHMPPVTRQLVQKLIPTSLMEVYEHVCSSHGSERRQNLFASLHGAAAASLCSGCSLYTRLAADFN